MAPEGRPSEPMDDRDGSSGRALPAWPVLALAAAAFFALAFGLRAIELETAYDVFIDEVTYGRIAESVAAGNGLAFFGDPFYLHPPLNFLVEATVVSLFDLGPNGFDLVFGLRWIGVVLGASSAVVVFLMVSRMGGIALGVLAGLLFAVDPFLIRFDSRVLLEALTVFWTLVGFAFLLSLARGMPRPDAPRSRRALAAGAAFGLAFLSKETSAVAWALPLVWCAVRNEPLRRRDAIITLLTAVAVYAVYPIVAVLSGNSGAYAEDKFGGLLRMLGLQQETGFNAPDAPSFLSRVFANLEYFAVDYLLLGLGLVAAVVLLRRGSRAERMIGLWTLSSFVLLGYQVTLGTLEEQMFYFLVVPALISIAVALPHAISVLRSRRPGRSVAIVGTTVLIAVFAFQARAWVAVHTNPDEAMSETIRYVEDNLPADSQIAALADGSQLLLPGYELVFDEEPSGLRSNGADYAITSSLQVEQGYGAARPDLVDWLERRAEVVHRARDRSYGRLVVWRLPFGNPPEGSPPGFPDQTPPVSDPQMSPAAN